MQAEQSGHRIKIVDVNIGDTVPGANFYADGYPGRARMVVDLDDGYLLGVTFVGPGVAELLHSATIAVAGKVPDRPAVARRALLPDHQRGVAAPAGSPSRHREVDRITGRLLHETRPRRPMAPRSGSFGRR